MDGTPGVGIGSPRGAVCTPVEPRRDSLHIQAEARSETSADVPPSSLHPGARAQVHEQLAQNLRGLKKRLASATRQ
jgi:hypothetical protein